MIGWALAVLRAQDFGPALGWVVHLHGNQESRQGQSTAQRGERSAGRMQGVVDVTGHVPQGAAFPTFLLGGQVGERRRMANC